MTGISGQDGVLLNRHLRGRGYRVFGLVRREALARPELADLLPDAELVAGDLSAPIDIADVVQHVQPDEVYNLAAQADVGSSWERAIETGDITGLGAHRIYEAVRRFSPKTRIYQASSSEMFGDVLESPQNERTAFNPTSPYGVAKVYAHQLAGIYRKSFDMFICCGILFNHESRFRGRRFLTQKVAHGAACAALGVRNSPERNERGQPTVRDGQLVLGNLDASRDWGFAGDYVDAMWRMLQLERPDDFVVGTGILRTVRDLCEVAYSHVGRDWREHVQSDPSFYRPWETRATVADASKARRVLGWAPTRPFEEFVREMVDAQVERVSKAVRTTA